MHPINRATVSSSIAVDCAQLAATLEMLYIATLIFSNLLESSRILQIIDTYEIHIMNNPLARLIVSPLSASNLIQL